MGNWTIIIQGLGCHHNNNAQIDANIVAAGLTQELLGIGQTISRAEFIVGANTDNLVTGERTAARDDVEYGILFAKRLRKEIDLHIQELKNQPPSRERALVITKLQEAVMWLGMDLKRINEENPGVVENPYPNSKDPSNTKVHPTADGLKM